MGCLSKGKERIVLRGQTTANSKFSLNEIIFVRSRMNCLHCTLDGVLDLHSQSLKSVKRHTEFNLLIVVKSQSTASS